MHHILKSILGCVLALSVSCAFAQQPPQKEWTFLIYINGKNSLDYFGAENIKAMEKLGSNEQMNIVVEWGSKQTGLTKRLLVQRSTNPSQVTSPILENLGSVDMGAYTTLQDFIQWGVTHYPAKHYFIDVWNHGSGWHLTGNHAASHNISFDDLTGNSINTQQLGLAMQFAAKAIGHKVDIYGSDACLMGMAEVADEMADSVDYFVGSQEVEPGAGWPYTDLLRQWQAQPQATPEQVAKILVNAYVASYQGGSNGNDDVTFSAYNLNNIAPLMTALANLSQDIQHLAPNAQHAIVTTLAAVQKFSYSDYVDLVDLMKKLIANPIPGLETMKLAVIQAAAENVILAHAGTSGFVNAHGMSIWFPTNLYIYQGLAQRYADLRFTTTTKWSEALAAMLR